VSATSPDKEKKGSKGTMNLQIWIPAVVAGVAAIALLLFMFTVVNSRRNNGRSRKGKQKAQWQQASEQVPEQLT
jgi:flagellar biosynthesis/type III secretory pathway M-ring protein FliF/YscJ